MLSLSPFQLAPLATKGYRCHQDRQSSFLKMLQGREERLKSLLDETVPVECISRNALDPQEYDLPRVLI